MNSAIRLFFIRRFVINGKGFGLIVFSSGLRFESLYMQTISCSQCEGSTLHGFEVYPTSTQSGSALKEFLVIGKKEKEKDFIINSHVVIGGS
jgi:hypothetical protein